MKVFLKPLTLLLAFTLLLGMMPPALAQSADTVLLSGQLLDRSLYVTSMAAHQGNLYIKADTGLYRFAPGDKDAVLLLERKDTYSNSRDDSGYFDVLLSDGQTLFAMNNQAGTLRPIHLNDSELSFGDTQELDWSSFMVEEDGNSYTRTPTNLVMYEDWLYMLTNDDQGQTTPVRVSLKTGEMQAFDDLKTVKQLTPYKDGRLLAMLFDEQNGYNQEAGRPNAPDLGVFDPQAGTMDSLGPIKEGMQNYWSAALCYDPPEDKLYFTDNHVIYYRQALGEPVPCAFLPSETGYSATSPLMVLYKGRLAAHTNTGIALREDNPQKMSQTSTLVIAGYADYDAVNRIAALMPEVLIDSQSVSYNSNEELVQAMFGRSADADIFVLDSRQHQVSSFLEKGYALELPAESQAAKLTAAMYPMIEELAVKDGKTYALPYELEFTVSMVTENLLREVGLPVPEDFFAICDTLQLWADGLHEKYPDYNYWTTFSNKEDLYYLAFDLYINAMRAKGLDVSFDTPLFRDMMARIEQMDTQAIDVDYDWQSPQSQEIEQELYSKTALIDRWYGYSPDMTHHFYQPVSKQEIALFSAEPGGKKVTPGSVRLLAVNPFSKNMDTALRFIDLYAQTMPAIKKVMLMPAYDEPIPNPHFDQEIESYKVYLGHLQEQAADNKAKGLPAGEIEADILMMENMLKDAETTLRFLLTQDDILSMRETIDMVYIPTSLHLLEDNSDLYSGFEQFKEGVIGLEQFIRDADSKLRMVRLENQ